MCVQQVGLFETEENLHSTQTDLHINIWKVFLHLHVYTQIKAKMLNVMRTPLVGMLRVTNG